MDTLDLPLNYAWSHSLQEWDEEVYRKVKGELER